MVKCTADGPRETDFVRLVSKLVVKYALRRDEYNTLDPERVIEISRKARGRFRKNDPKAELGELILFALLESERQAPQIINKMALKMHGNVPVLGFDAIHVKIGEGDTQLFFGESKMMKDLVAAIGEAVKDIADRKKDVTRVGFEIDLVCNYLDESRFKDHIDQIRTILDPYAPNKGDLSEINSIFIGSNWTSFKVADWSTAGAGLEEHLAKVLSEEIPRIRSKCEELLTRHEVQNLTEFFFIPFTSVDRVGAVFKEMIR
jgi:hypothetical protein